MSTDHMSPLEKYKTATAVTSGSNNQLVFVFDEILKLLVSAQKAIENKNYDLKFRAVSKAIEVFYILKSGLDAKILSKGDEAIDIFYGATIHQLENINMKDVSTAEIQPIIEAVSEIRMAL